MNELMKRFRHQFYMKYRIVLCTKRKVVQQNKHSTLRKLWMVLYQSKRFCKLAKQRRLFESAAVLPSKAARKKAAAR